MRPLSLAVGATSTPEKNSIGDSLANTTTRSPRRSEGYTRKILPHFRPSTMLAMVLVKQTLPFPHGVPMMRNTISRLRSFYRCARSFLNTMGSPSQRDNPAVERTCAKSRAVRSIHTLGL